MKISDIIYDYGKYILICLAIILAFVIAILFLRMNTSDKENFAVGISEITGSASVNRSSSNVVAYTGMYIRADDVVSAAENSSVTIKLDSNSFVTLEAGTTAYFSESAENKITLNVTSGAVFCDFNNSDDILTVKTPNSAVSSDSGLFRISFRTADSIADLTNAYITDLFCFDGNVAAQLYNKSASPVEGLMQVLPKKSCELITADENALYGYLNQDIELKSMPFSTIQKLITLSASRPIGYTLSELNSAIGRVAPETEETAPVFADAVLSETSALPQTDATAASESETTQTETTTEPVTTTTEAPTTTTAATTRATTTAATTTAAIVTTPVTTAATTAPTTVSEETTIPSVIPSETEITSETEPTVTRKSVSRRLITTTQAPEPQTNYRPKTEAGYFGPDL